ncbi:MAG: outer membrane lipoprotein carrier protein LolA [Cyclobacteriaceae bacterium]|nr:outer membrane lipoprotein carrier protein LolA [Cyclobacteriaceae bacterium]
MKKIKMAMIVFFAAHVVLGQYDPEAKAILDAMSARYRKIPAFTATFTQQLTNESAGLDEKISGSIAVKGNKYKLNVAGQQIFNDGTDIWAYNAEAREVTVSPYVVDDQEISLSNIWDIYKEGFKYALLENNDRGNRVIDLDPIDRSKSYFKIRMEISPANELRSFTVFENTGTKYIYTIGAFKEVATLQDSDFTFNPQKYPGVEVIDFRE